jgi:UDP-galactopyranose mutase
MESLPRGFLPYVKNIRLNTEVTRIIPKKKRMVINGLKEVSYSKIISSLPLPNLIRIIEDVPKNVENAVKKLEYNWVFAVNIGIDKPSISNKHWIYFPEDKFIFHRISFPMNLSPFNAPKGKSSITAEISGSKYKHVDREDIEEKVLSNLREAGILNKNDKILFVKTFLINPAYIIYDLNHQKNVEIIDSFLKENGILSCGRFGEWEYFNMDHSILSGRDAALKLR